MKLKHGYYDLFVASCAKYPTREAVRQCDFGEYRLYTYSELYGICEYLAQSLQQLKCNKNNIGIITDRNVIVPCIIAAAHKCSATFMFLNPKQKVKAMVDKLMFQIVVTISQESNPFPRYWTKAPDLTTKIFGYAINFYQFSPQNTILRKIHQPEPSFIASTSGSTGEPKQIEVPIQCIQPNIDDLTKLFTITPDDIIYFSTPLTFDPAMIEILLACMNGASLLIAPHRAEYLFPTNKKHSVTICQLTPSKFFQFTNTEIKQKILGPNSTLRILALGGEPFNGMRKLREFKHKNNKTKIFTLYGVTEMSCWACAAELDLNQALEDKDIPLGKCLSETEVKVQPNSENINTGNIILISKTRKCNVLNTSTQLGKEEIKPNDHAIDTGDIGEVKNGAIYYRGRTDDIIKRFGHKINLQTVENTIMDYSKIKACSCVWLPKPSLMVVYYTSEEISTKELSDFIRCKLDDTHWPDKIIRVGSIPTNDHGKASKTLLSKLYVDFPTVPQTMQSLKFNFLQELRVLLDTNFTYDDVKDKDFFSLGGTSFMAVTLCNRLALTHPKLGRLILTHLITPQNTIERTMNIAEKDITADSRKAKRRLSVLATSDVDFTDKISHPSTDVLTATTSVESKTAMRATFEVEWVYDTGKCVDGSPVMLAQYENLYIAVGSHSGKVIVFEALTGMLQGIIYVKARVEASVHCYIERSRGICCGVVGAYDGTIVSFRLETCEENWRINIGKMVKSKATSLNGMIFVAAYDGSVRCIDMETGQVKELITIAEQPISADLVLAKQQYILTGTLSGVCAGVHAETRAVAWRGNVGSPIFASPVVYDHDRYVVFAEVNGEIHCRTVARGIKIWKFKGAKGNIFSSLFVKAIYKLHWQMAFGCHDNNVYCINVINFQASLNWKTELNSPVYSTPCWLCDNKLLAASKNGTLYVIAFDNGDILSEYQLPNETFSSPAVFNKFVYIGCRDDNMYCLKYNE